MNKSYFFKFLLAASLACPLVGSASSEPWTIEDVLRSLFRTLSADARSGGRTAKVSAAGLCLGIVFYARGFFRTFSP